VNTAYAQQSFPEIADPTLPVIATLKVRPDGTPVIVYNPIICAQRGPALCGFYRMHERGHIALRHVENKIPLAKSEPEADCWAAKNAPREWVMAAYNWFLAGAWSPPQHGSSRKRAEKIRACAGF
jgi:hypothetical protein